MLATHGLSFLSKADVVMVMEDGYITEMGSYLDLMERKGAFAKFIKTFNGTQRKKNSIIRDKSRNINSENKQK